MQLEHLTTDTNTPEQKTKNSRFTQYTMLSLFLGLVLFFGIVELMGNAPNKKRPSPDVKAASTHDSPMRKPTPASPPPVPSGVTKTSLRSPTLSMEKMPSHASATVSGFPGMNKVVMNASLKITENSLLFTNNERQDWPFCYATINFDSGPSNWYEYDFTGIPAGQTHTVVWSQLARKDGTHYTNASDEQKSIQLICLLGDNTVGFARFPSISLDKTR